MIVPWQQIAPETLESLLREFVLREGTDYGEIEISVQDKIDQVKQSMCNYATSSNGPLITKPN